MSISDKDIIGILTRKTAQLLMSGCFTGQHKQINFSKLIKILPTESRTGADRYDQRHNQLKNNLLSYTREQLEQIRQEVRHCNLLGLLSGSIANILRHKI